MRKRDCAWFLALCLALPVLSAEAQLVPAQDVPQADELVAEDTAALDLDVPDGAEVSLGGVAQGARRRIELKPFPVGRYVPYAVRVRFAGGGELTRTVLLHGGWRVRLPIAAPGTFRPEVVPQTGHDVGVWSVAWSPDGRQALTGSLDGSAILWDAASGLQLRTFRGRALAVRSVAFSLDGKRIAVAGEGDPTDPKGDVTVFDTATGREHLRFDGHRGGVWGVAFSPDGRFLLTGSEDGTAILWNAATAQRLRTFARDGHSAPILAVAFSADGTEVLTGSRDHAAMLWDVASGLKARSFTGHTDAVRAVAFRPSDGPAQVATTSYDGTARLWDAATGQLLHTLKGHTKPVRALAYRHDGRTLFTGSSDGVLIEWDADTGREIRRIPGHDNWSQSLAVSPDDKWLLAAYDDNRASVIDLASGGLRKSLVGHIQMIGALAVSPDGMRLMCGYTPDVAAVWDLEQGQQARRLKKHPPLASGESNSIQALAFSPDGRLALTGARDRTAIIWDWTTGQPLRTLSGLKGEVIALAFSPDGRHVATAGGWFGPEGEARQPFGELVVWDAQTGQKQVTFPRQREALLAIAYSPDGRLLLSGGRDSQAVLWNADTGRAVRALRGHRGPVAAVGFSKNGQRIVTGSLDQTAIIWNATTAAPLRTLAGHTNWLNAAAFSPDDRLVVTASLDHTAIVWDAETGKSVQTLRGHSDNVMAAAFRPDGRQVITGSWDGSARLWDVATGDELGQLLAIDSGRDWLVVAPDGLFDGSAGGREKVAFRVGQGLSVVAVDRFFKDFFRPGLLAELAAGQRLRPNTKLGQSVPPSLRIVSPEQDAPVEAPRVVLEVEALDQGGGVEGPWLFHNGTRVRAPGRPSRQGQTVHQQFPVALVEGENRLEVRASSADGSWESEPARLWLRFEKPIEKPALFMLSVGVNKYAQNRFNLQYAADDAHAMAELFKHRGPSLYREVYITELLDKEATRKGIALALEEFAQKAQPRDTLIVFLAGHGMMIGERYYFIPSEFHLEGPASLEAAIKENGLAADALADELTAVPALKRLLVIDTCQSGGAVAMALRQRGAFGLRGAIERLGRAQGLFAIAAAAPSQEAHEVAELGHGILSYTLLAGLHDVRAGPLRDKAIPSGPDRVADVLTWFNFASDQVPQLTRRYFGSEQDVQTSSQGMSFPLLPLEDGS